MFLKVIIFTMKNFFIKSDIKNITAYVYTHRENLTMRINFFNYSLQKVKYSFEKMKYNLLIIIRIKVILKSFPGFNGLN